MSEEITAKLDRLIDLQEKLLKELWIIQQNNDLNTDDICRAILGS